MRISTPADICAVVAFSAVPVNLIVYPGASHAFNFPAPARQYLGHHLAYDPQATADAWQHVRSFQQATLGEAPPADTKPASGSAAQTH